MLNNLIKSEVLNLSHMPEMKQNKTEITPQADPPFTSGRLQNRRISIAGQGKVLDTYPISLLFFFFFFNLPVKTDVQHRLETLYPPPFPPEHMTNPVFLLQL